MNVLQDLVHYMEREIRQDGRWFLEFSSWESCAVTFPRFRSAMRLWAGGGGGETGSMPGTHLAPAMAGTLRTVRLTSSARAWPIKGNPACLRQRQTLVNSRKQNNPATNQLFYNINHDQLENYQSTFIKIPRVFVRGIDTGSNYYYNQSTVYIFLKGNYYVCWSMYKKIHNHSRLFRGPENIEPYPHRCEFISCTADKNLPKGMLWNYIILLQFFNTLQ